MLKLIWLKVLLGIFNKLMATIDELISKVKAYVPEDKLSLLEEAYRFAAQAHGGQLRLSGEPYVQHPLQTALILADLRLDISSLVGALLHDVYEDSDIPLSEIEAHFGNEVAKLVEGVTKLSKVVWQAPDERKEHGIEDVEVHAENVRRMLVAMAEDIRVVLIKLADRLHNMRTLDALSPQSRRRIAQETLEIYAPLAHRLGIWEMHGQLEDLAFLHLEPEEYRRIANLVDKRGAAGREFINRAIQVLSTELEKTEIKAELSGRPKNIYSIYHKMQRYSSQGRGFGEIYDIIALRVIVDEVDDCYKVLGVVHGLWHPIHGGFDDYIANPKDNNYQSLHSVVMCFGTTPLEIQIRTREMHRKAEYGIAAHWFYKAGGEKKDAIQFEERISWLRQLMQWHRELKGSAEFLESVKTDIFEDQVFIYTPKGEIIDLPSGSTPLDFAYSIHTDLGHRCIGAKVNGRLTALNTQLTSGDTVEVIVAKKGKGPSRDWINPNLGYVKTSQAKSRIRQWFKKAEKGENVNRGKDILERELRRLAITVSIQGGIAALFNYKNEEDFFSAVGYGEVSPQQIAAKLAAQEPSHPLHMVEKVSVGTVSAAVPAADIQVLGVGNMLTHLAQCCHPVPGDEIIGYITRGSGVSVHRKNCSNIIHEDEKERLIPVEWGHIDRLYPVSVRVEVWNRVGLMRDISAIVAADAVNMNRIDVDSHDDNTATILLTIETKGIEQLSKIMAKIEGINGVINVGRSTDAGKGSDLSYQQLDAYGIY